jgi:DNA-binding response OmpR family regulator
LEKENFEVFAVQSEKEICQIFENQKIDLLIIDVALENVRGLEILEELKRKFDFKVIVFSSFVENATREKIKKMKIKEFISGANDLPNELLAKVKRIIK